MLITILTTAIAVIGTLAGATLNSRSQARAAREQRFEIHINDHIKEVRAAVASLVAVLDKHRGVMWTHEQSRLLGTTRQADSETTTASRATISEPLTQLCLLAPQLATVAREAADATYELRESPTIKELDIRREKAKQAVIRLTDAAASHLRGYIPVLLPSSSREVRP